MKTRRLPGMLEHRRLSLMRAYSSSDSLFLSHIDASRLRVCILDLSVTKVKTIPTVVKISVISGFLLQQICT